MTEPLPKQLVYVDTPIASTVGQVMPFYENGFFDHKTTPLALKRRPALSAQMLFSRHRHAGPVKVLSSKLVQRLPVQPGGEVYYPFNSMSNMNMVNNRSLHHVLILHGESNKNASFRPAARLYDYITIAGPMARQRYLDHGIFTAAELDNGRVIMMGDTFVQSIPWLKPQTADEGAILYSPTWEGYGGPENNFSSIKGGRGFTQVISLAKSRDIAKIIVKPHPYLGTLKPWMIRDFIRGVKALRRAGLSVSIALSGVNFAVRAAVRTWLRSVPLLDSSTTASIAFGICDVSGMEALLLKQKIPCVVLTSGDAAPEMLRGIYALKALDMNATDNHSAAAYLTRHAEIDEAHRALIFGWHTPDLEQMAQADRNIWLSNFVKTNAYWHVNHVS